jgi:hypothetical protein
MPNPSMPCRWASPETALRQGRWPAAFFYPFKAWDTSRRTPLFTYGFTPLRFAPVEIPLWGFYLVKGPPMDSKSVFMAPENFHE